MIFDSYPSQAGDGMSRVTAYAIALDGIREDAQRAVMIKIIKGNLFGFDGKFCPTPALLASWCRDEQADLERRERDRNRPRLVPYAIGENPPKGYVALGEYEERRADLLENKSDGDAA